MVKLSQFQNSWYHPGRSRLLQALWFFVGLPLLRCAVVPSSGLRVRLLRWFGARVGTGAVIKPGVRIKYPWLFQMGDNSWLGEDCWIDNLARVELGHDVCVSQGAYLCTGNHNWTDPSFGLIVEPIRLEDGAWAGARSVICPGVTIGSCGILSAGSVAVRDVPPYEIHGGNPASFLRARRIGERESSAVGVNMMTST